MNAINTLSGASDPRKLLSPEESSKILATWVKEGLLFGYLYPEKLQVMVNRWMTDHPCRDTSVLAV